MSFKYYSSKADGRTEISREDAIEKLRLEQIVALEYRTQRERSGKGFRMVDENEAIHIEYGLAVSL